MLVAATGLMEMSSGDEVITANQLQGLQGLPEELLDAVLSQLDARSQPGRSPFTGSRLQTLSLDADVEMSEYVVGQEQLGALLALTQITSLQVQRFSGLTSSWASTACSWRQLEVNWMNWVTAAYLPLHSLTHPLRLYQLVGNMNLYELEGDIEDLSIEVLAAAELNLCENNKAGLVLDGALCLSKATVDLLIEQYLSHSRRTAHQPPHPAMDLMVVK
ncbi:hypothetical protein HaLaN_27940 [Haematococcus lacustris]|uniref:Uncharacterized protein n=1 Tax=Haematococcus lacustris TaxID=44745 RepID=A0A6A0A9P7_HAELA|nr:hypothetical protein HaLaN_27940 [Haematococcus lacustris]